MDFWNLWYSPLESQKRYAAEFMAALHGAGFPAHEGTLYPLLSKLRRDGAVVHEWQESLVGPPRKYFSLTNDGKRQLAELRNYWSELARMIETVGR